MGAAAGSRGSGHSIPFRCQRRCGARCPRLAAAARSAVPTCLSGRQRAPSGSGRYSRRPGLVLGPSGRHFPKPLAGGSFKGPASRAHAEGLAGTWLSESRAPGPGTSRAPPSRRGRSSTVTVSAMARRHATRDAPSARRQGSGSTGPRAAQGAQHARGGKQREKEQRPENRGDAGPSERRGGTEQGNLGNMLDTSPSPITEPADQVLSTQAQDPPRAAERAPAGRGGPGLDLGPGSRYRRPGRRRERRAGSATERTLCDTLGRCSGRPWRPGGCHDGPLDHRRGRQPPPPPRRAGIIRAVRSGL